MRKHYLGALVVSALVTSGCATVQSTPRGQNELAPGVTYFLPKREIKVTAERKLLKKDELQKTIATKKTELETVKASVKTAEATIKIANERLKSPSVQASAAAMAKINEELAIATADLELSKAKQASVENEIKLAEASLRILEATPGKNCAFSYSAAVELLAPVADTKLRLVANTYHSPLRDDDIKLAVNSAGLFSSANVIAADRTGDILVEIASALSGLGSGSGQTLAFDGEPELSDTTTCEQLPTKFAYRLDPSRDVEVAALNTELQEAAFPFRLEVPHLIQYYRFADESARIIDRQRVMGRPAEGNKDEYPLGDALRHQGKNGALFYRTALPQTIILRQCKAGTACSVSDQSQSVPIDAAVTMLPQIGPISYIPMRSSAFVKTVDDVVFDNGMLVSWDASRPSEVLEIVRLPVKILKSIVSVPAEIVKLRIDLSDQQKGLAASQQAQIEAQAKLSKIQACVNAAADDNDRAMACFSMN
jgi:hypothetical protein